MGGTVLLTSLNTCFSSPFAISKNTQVKMISILFLQSDISEERKKSKQMHILKLPYAFLALTTFHTGTSATYQHLALWTL